MIENKRRVLQIIPGFPTGGAEQVVLSYLRYFKNDDMIDMRCLSLSNNQNRLYEKQIVEETLPVFFFDKAKKSKAATRFNQIRMIRKIVNDFQPEVVHVHLSILWIVVVALLGKKARIYHTLHNDPRKLTAGFGKIVCNICYNWFGVTPIALNKEYKQVADLLYSTECRVLGNGINIDNFRNIDKREAREILHINDNTFVVGHIGRFHIQKNHKTIIGAFALVKEKVSDAILVLVGEGELKSEIEKIVEEKNLSDCVYFLGSRSDIPYILKAMDVFLFPSLYEGLGIVLVEAQAAGIRCVVSDAIPRETIVTDKVCSIKLDAPYAEWAEAIINEGAIAEIPNKTLDAYSIQSICNELLDIYEINIVKN